MKDDRNPSQNGPLRVAVVGAGEVGKSALTVRYLTKRFIGEYRSDTDLLYKCVLQVDGSSQPVEIMDTSARANEESSDAHLLWAEAFVVVYSVSDKKSYKWAANTLEELSARKPSACILMLGNKSDLSHLREVEEVEARSLALTHAARFSEVSTAESGTPVSEVLDGFLKEVKSQRNANHSHNGGSPKLRKISVTKMLGSLIGRNSPPPIPTTHLIILDKEEKSKLQGPMRQLCRPCLRPAHSLPCSPHTAV
ncbi:ras-related and estrogen-regulated growth inhibitor-like protein [Palaemon carinicauda]|uniref:ras-related and estrogen-regulated growth inhibitor-like protein n=1 Tax=Palaemon carinicauda TaxID=392227 RepID=UPI0035B5A418